MTGLSASAAGTADSPSAGQVNARPSRRGILISGSVLGFIVVVAILAPWIVPDPYKQDLASNFAAPLSHGHLLGTDSNGRDLLSRIVWGARISLIISLTGVLGSVVVGSLAGFGASLGGRWARFSILRLIDAQMAFPYVLLAITLASALTPSIATLILLMVLAGWPTVARLVRSVVLAEMEKDYTLAAMSLGASRRRIMRKYLTPTVVPSLLAFAPLQMSAMMVLESTLSFLGLGVRPPTPSWGNIMLGGETYMSFAWWITTLPGIAIALTCGSLLGLGRSLENHLSWRRRYRASFRPGDDVIPSIAAELSEVAADV